MTKIKLIDNKIIFDGHADSRQECETITLLCNNLAQSKDFKTVTYESGYAEFEKIAQARELKFPSSYNTVTFIFDENIISVDSVTSSGGSATYKNLYDPFDSESHPFTVVLKDGYVIDTVTFTPEDEGTYIHEQTDTTINFVSGDDEADYTITITSKQGGTSNKKSVDMSTLSGWANVTDGTHTLTIKAKASGYADSVASSGVSFTKR